MPPAMNTGGRSANLQTGLNVSNVLKAFDVSALNYVNRSFGTLYRLDAQTIRTKYLTY